MVVKINADGQTRIIEGEFIVSLTEKEIEIIRHDEILFSAHAKDIPFYAFGEDTEFTQCFGEIEIHVFGDIEKTVYDCEKEIFVKVKI